MLTSIKNTKDKARAVLEKYPQTQDSDALLYLLFLDEYGDLLRSIGSENFMLLKKLMLSFPPPETLRRLRQKIQEGGELTGTKCHKRQEAAVEVRGQISTLNVSSSVQRDFWGRLIK